MKKLFLLVVFFVPVWLFAQAVDTVGVEKQVDSLLQISRDLTRKQEFEKALEINEIAEKIAIEGVGRESKAYGSCCLGRGRILYFKRDYSESEKSCLESKSIREKVLGKGHVEYANVLFSLGLLYFDMAKYKESELYYLECLTLYKINLGEEHALYISTLNNLANVYYQTSLYKKSESLYLEVLALREKTIGKNHPNYIKTLNTLSRVYNAMEDYEKSESLGIEALNLSEKTLGKNSPSYGQSLNLLAHLYWEMGFYEKAERFCIESMSIVEKVIGKQDLDYFSGMVLLGNIYNDTGQYQKAESIYLESLIIIDQSFGKSHPYFAAILNNLSVLYWKLGNYKKSETLLLESIGIIDTYLGKENIDYAKNINNLANLYKEMCLCDKSEKLYAESREIYYKIFGKDNTNYAISLFNLASLYLTCTIDYIKAESLCLESKQILEKLPNHENGDYAMILNNLGNLYREIGKYEASKSCYLDAKRIVEKSIGVINPFYATVSNNLACLYWKLNDLGKTSSFVVESSTLNQEILMRSIFHLSQQELNDYLKTFSVNQARALSFSQTTYNTQSIQTALDNTLFFKGFLLNSSNQIKRLATTDSLTTEKYNLLKSYGRRLAAEYSKSIADRDSIRVADLEEKSNTLEKELVRTVAGFGEALKQVHWQDVQAALQPGEAAIEFVHYQFHNPDPQDSIMYAAFVQLPGARQPVFIPLFEERQLNALIQKRSLARKGYAKSLYEIAPSENTPALYRLLWQPLEKELEGVNTIYFSPSGLLHRINLSAIPSSGVRKEDGISLPTLGDKYNLVQLGSTRQVAVPLRFATSKKDAVLFGGIRYDMDTTAFAQANRSVSTDSTRGLTLFSYSDSTLRGGAWSYLSGTDKEVNELDPLLQKNGFQTTTLKGYAASEEAFKNIGKNASSPRILHLATHGFFFEDPKIKADSRTILSDQEPVFKISEHPMIRSGLVLAGGNYAWKTGKSVHPDMEDGILTAYEISQMNLSGTELVVLSACETGLGDIKGNEGVFGLQRAFKIAGAKYLVMSLWPVDDQKAVDFMNTFYRHWLTDAMPIPDAFRTTQLEMQAKYKDPYLWAGFVLVE
ncbi:MAG: CHAT domain-containing protein [Bacteroidetes bacterium]|nr:CHAT domain-containing protein [Bacteroidota bacterium]